MLGINLRLSFIAGSIVLRMLSLSENIQRTYTKIKAVVS